MFFDNTSQHAEIQGFPGATPWTVGYQYIQTNGSAHNINHTINNTYRKLHSQDIENDLQVFMITYLVLVSVIGFVGNVTVIVIIMKHQRFHLTAYYQVIYFNGMTAM